MGKMFGLAAAAILCLVLSNAGSTVAEEERPAFVIVERTDYHRTRDYSARVRQACTRNSSQVCRPLSSSQPREHSA